MPLEFTKMGFAFYELLQVQEAAPVLVCDAVADIGCARQMKPLAVGLKNG